MKRFNSFWVYALVLAVFVALIVWRMQRQAEVGSEAPASVGSEGVRP